MSVKSLVKIVNTGAEETINTVTFPTGTPVCVYRRDLLFSDGPSLGKLTHFFSSEQFVGYSFNGNANTKEESIDTCNVLFNQTTYLKQQTSLSSARIWKKEVCEEMLDGLMKQMEQFDWMNAVKKEDDFFEDANHTVSALAAGYLDLAHSHLVKVPAEAGADEFFVQARKDSFVELFESVLGLL